MQPHWPLCYGLPGPGVNVGDGAFCVMITLMLCWLVLHSLTSFTWLDAGLTVCRASLCQHQCVTVTKTLPLVSVTYNGCWHLTTAQVIAFTYYMFTNIPLVVNQGLSHMFYYAFQVTWNKLVIYKSTCCTLKWLVKLWIKYHLNQFVD